MILLQRYVVTLAFKVTTNVARDTLFQYSDHSCEIVVIFDFKSQSYGPDFVFTERSNCDLDL